MERWEYSEIDRRGKVDSYREEIKRLAEQCQDERDLWLIWRFAAGRVKGE